MNDYIVASRSTQNGFSVTARSVSKNAHWVREGNTYTDTTDPVPGRTVYLIIKDGLTKRQAERVKDAIKGAMILNGVKLDTVKS